MGAASGPLGGSAIEPVDLRSELRRSDPATGDRCVIGPRKTARASVGTAVCLSLWTSPHGCVCGGVLSPWPSHSGLPTASPPGPFLLPALHAQHASPLSLPPAFPFAWKPLCLPPIPGFSPVSSASPGQWPFPRGPCVCLHARDRLDRDRASSLSFLSSSAAGRAWRVEAGAWLTPGSGSCPRGARLCQPVVWPGPACSWLL